MRKFTDIELVRQDLKDAMPLNQFIAIADDRYKIETGVICDIIEKVSDHLYKKKCDLDSHPMDKDGSRDSTASFTICPQKELWHCFGCGEHGDRFEYLSTKFNLSHIEAITMCAELENIDLSSYYEDISQEDQIKNSLFNENDTARTMAHLSLLSNERALNYLHSRGITDESIELFRIGYAPPLTGGEIVIFNNIANMMNLQLNRKNQFNDAILFPITDASGRMRYFQSRPFEPLPGMKYIGGDDTHPLFDEYDRIYGFNIAKKKLFKTSGKLVGVEGAPDVIACVQQDINAIGFLGTSINQNTFDLLDKHRVTELTMLLDGDKAGRDKSIKNAAKYLTLNTRVRLKIAILEEGYDPEEYINKFGADGLKKAIDNAVYAIQYLIDSIVGNVSTPTGKMDYMNSIQPYMSSINDKMVKQIMITHVASKIGLDPIQIDDYFTQVSVDGVGARLFSPDGEEILLGEALRNPEFIFELQTKFSDEDWYLIRHRYLYRILKTNTQLKDIESIFTVAKNLNIDGIVTYAWLASLLTKVGDINFVMNDVEDKLIRRKSLDIIDKAKAQLNDMSQDSLETIDRSFTSVFEVAHKKVDNRIFSASSQVKNIMEVIHERMKNPGKIIGFSFGPGFQRLDRALLGLMTKSITIVSANQSVGKTQICENFALSQIINDKIPTLWFTLEMDEERMTFRNLSILSGVSSIDIMTGNINGEEKKLVDDAAIKLSNAPFWLSECGHDLSEALAIARRYVMKHNVKIIYVDYIQLQYVTDRKTDQRHRELGWISKSWKQLANELDISVVLISQLNKSALSAETAEAEHASGSYEIAQDADNFITLKDKSDDEINQHGIEHGQITMNISKNRMGEREILINIYKNGPNYRMQECM